MFKICIVAHFGYGALLGGQNGHFGGVERQTSLMSRWLVARGHTVNFLTWDEDQEPDLEVESVRVIKMCRQDDGLPGIRFFYPRWSSLNRAMALANADIYYQNCAEYVTGQVAFWCRRHGRKFVYAVASDPDCDPRLPEMKTRRERILYRLGLRKADRIVVQTLKQKEMLRSGFGLDAIILPMPCPGPDEHEEIRAMKPKKGQGRILWVGRFSEAKRLEWLLEAATSLPTLQFDVAGAPDHENGYSRSLLAKAGVLSNVTLLGKVPRQEMEGLYRRSSLLCCTSRYEGFPNTFLEAWSYGLPVISTVDPDDLIVKNNLGMAARSTQEVAAVIEKLMKDMSLRQELSENARRYYLKHHALEPAMIGFENLFVDVLEGSQRIPRGFQG